MKNLRNIFKEYNDPRIYRDLKIGFACLIVLGILITFAVSPSLRHEIGIGNNEPVPISKEHHDHVHENTNHVQPQGQRGRTHNGPPSHANAHSNPITTHPPSKGHGGSESVPSPPNNPIQPEHESPESPSDNPGSSSTPEPANHSAEDNGKGKIKVEVPIIEVPPVVEEVTHGVEEKVNGVTGTVNEVTKEIPVQVEAPKVCVVTC